MAMAGVILIAAIWTATFVIGVTGGDKKLLTAFLVLSVVVPVLMYAILLVARTVSGKPAIDEIDAAVRSGRMNTGSADKESESKDPKGRENAG